MACPLMDRLIVFTRYPVPGVTKTRLIPELGHQNAADVHRRLTENIIHQIIQLQTEKELLCDVCYTGGSKEEMERWLGNELSYAQQVQGDLGVRMYKAIKGVLDTGAIKIILIGTDILEPVSGYIEKALSVLNENDIVLGPTIDGGYWLVGMKRAFNIFDGIPWGTETVLIQTLSLIKQQRLKVFLLPEINDIDRVDDLIKYMEHEIIKQHLSEWLSFQGTMKQP